MVNGRLDGLNRVIVLGQAFVAGPCKHPDARHSGHNLARAVGSNATARAIAKALRAIHGATSTGAVDSTLAATLGIEEDFLYWLFNNKNCRICTLIARHSDQWMQEV